jgi:hypothetical protein
MTASNVEHDTASHTFVGQLTLGTTITVSVRFGPEGVYSGGSDVETTCPQTVPITITTPPVSEPAVVTPPAVAGTSQPAPVPVRAAPGFTG